MPFSSRVPLSRPVAVLVALVALAGCGEAGRDYERAVSRLCRTFNDAAFARQVEIGRARALYVELADGLHACPRRRTYGALTA